MKNYSLPRILTAFITLGAVVLIVNGVYRHRQTAKDTANEPVNETHGVVTDWTSNVQITAPAEWSLVSTGTIATPKDIPNIHFTLQRASTSCIFAYADAPIKIFEIYTQTSFADRVFGDLDPTFGLESIQFDSSWYLHRDYLPAAFQFQWTGKQPFPHEVRIIPDSSIGRRTPETRWGMFLLYDASGSIVPDNCNAEANAILQTATVAYQETRLSQNSHGSLYTKSGRLVLLGDDDITREVMPFPRESREIAVQENKLYYVGKDKQFYALDPFTQQNRAITSDLSASSSVIDFVLSGSTAFALVSNDQCDFSCITKLISINLNTGMVTALSEEINANRISGLDEKNNTVYISRNFGDGGCWSASVMRFSLSEKTISPIKDFGDCGDDGKEYGKLQHLLESFAVRPVEASYVAVQNGTLQNPGATPLDDASFSNFKFMLAR